MTSPLCEFAPVDVESPNLEENNEYLVSEYEYQTTKILREDGRIKVKPLNQNYTFRTLKHVPKVGVLMVGLGGNNGTTVTGGILANKHNLTWETNRGEMSPNYYGSLTQATTTFLGMDENNRQVYVPLKNMIPMVDPNNLVIGGWDINKQPLDVAMRRASVYHANLQKKLQPYMKDMVPMPSIYYPDFIAANQFERADNILPGKHACKEHLEHIRQDIRDFKKKNGLDKVIVVWTANTERYSDVIKGVHDTEKNLMLAISQGHKEIAPSQIFAVASILEGCAYINGSPQNTFCPAIMEMASKRNVYIAGDDFKSGQTKFKSVLVDFLVNSGLKPESIVSYNHLGNNDGKNLSAPKQFRSKEISKSNVVDDMVASNGILYDRQQHEKPDHCVVIKYVPHVRDSKRAMDEYISTIFMNGWNTIVCHNTCEDSLLAAPIILDLIIMTELFQRIQWRCNSMAVDNVEQKEEEEGEFYGFDSVLTILSFLLKAPLVPKNTPLVNALFKQRSCIENILRACLGLPPINDMLLEFKTIYNQPPHPVNFKVQEEDDDDLVEIE